VCICGDIDQFAHAPWRPIKEYGLSSNIAATREPNKGFKSPDLRQAMPAPFQPTILRALRAPFVVSDWRLLKVAATTLRLEPSFRYLAKPLCKLCKKLGGVELIGKMGCFDAPWHLPDFERDISAPGSLEPLPSSSDYCLSSMYAVLSRSRWLETQAIYRRRFIFIQELGARSLRRPSGHRFARLRFCDSSIRFLMAGGVPRVCS
jgi:hypothetical protein